MSQETSFLMTQKIKGLLDIFDKVGVAARKDVANAPEKYHPKNLLADFESVIVFAQGSKAGNNIEMGGFSDYMAAICAQTDVLSYLDSLGYKAIIVEGTNQQISLVKMGEAAGVGEVSPVNSLVVKGFGLTASLGAIITDAKLISDDRTEGICIHCNKCLKVCPIRDTAYAKGDLSWCGCGACQNVCPV